MGLGPIFTNALGMFSECSLSLMPSPPQKRTTFIHFAFRYPAACRAAIFYLTPTTVVARTSCRAVAWRLSLRQNHTESDAVCPYISDIPAMAASRSAEIG